MGPSTGLRMPGRDQATNTPRRKEGILSHGAENVRIFFAPGNARPSVTPVAGDRPAAERAQKDGLHHCAGNNLRKKNPLFQVGSCPAPERRGRDFPNNEVSVLFQTGCHRTPQRPFLSTLTNTEDILPRFYSECNLKILRRVGGYLRDRSGLLPGGDLPGLSSKLRRELLAQRRHDLGHLSVNLLASQRALG